MKVAICTAVWGRPHVTRLWWTAINRVRSIWADDYGIDSWVVAGGSEPVQKEMCGEHSGEWITLPNSPLGNKFNGVVQRACNSAPDYIMILGSDDFLSNEVAREYVPLFRASVPYFGLAGIYFYDIIHKRIALMKHYPEGHSCHGQVIGAGRAFIPSLIRHLWNRPWTNEKYQALDADFNQRVKPPAPRMIGVHRRSIALDVKCCTNIWSFDDLARVFGLVEPAEPNHLNMLPEWAAIQRLEPEEKPRLAARSLIGKALVRHGN